VHPAGVSKGSSGNPVNLIKQAGSLLERIADPGNLRLAVIKSIRGKRGRSEVLAYAAGS
jgi:hypothetical protein